MLASEKFLGPTAVPIRVLLYENGNTWAVRQNPLEVPIFHHRADDAFVCGVNLANFARRPDAGTDRFSLARRVAIERMIRRTPSPPPWLRIGLVKLWNGIRRDTHGIRLNGLDTSAVAQSKNPAMRIPLPPFEELFCTELVEEHKTDLARSQAWHRGIEWLMLWAFSDQRRREAFWRLAMQASRKPVDEAALKHHFGLNYAQLIGVLARRVNGEGQVERFPPIRIKSPASSPRVQLRDATEEQIRNFRDDIDLAIKRQPTL